MSIRRCKSCELDTIAGDWRHNRCPNCGEMAEPTPDPHDASIAALQQQVRELEAEIESRDNQENACLREARELAGRRDLHSSFDGYRWIRERIVALTKERDEALATRQRQQKLLAWAVENFGQVALDKTERALRLIEEAIELVQVQGLSREQVITVLDRTYSRPVGDLKNEIGGLAMTLEALAETEGLRVETLAGIEFVRITSLPKSFWQKKHAEKVAAGSAIGSARAGGGE